MHARYLITTNPKVCQLGASNARRATGGVGVVVAVAGGVGVGVGPGTELLGQ